MRRAIAGLAVFFLGAALAGCPGDSGEPVVVISGDSTVQVDGTLQLTATTINLEDAESEAYTWASGDDTVATVDDTGLVTGVAAGEAVITATGADSGASGSHNVVVVTEGGAGEAVVTVTVPNFQLEVGGTVVATATTINGEDTGYTWASSDDAIATVDANGSITAVAAGEAVISATGDVTGEVGSVGVVVLPEAGVTPDDVPFFAAWAGSGHADSTAEAFRHWDGDAEVPTNCATCHSSQGFVDFAEDGTVDAAVPADQVTGITCQACHSAAGQMLDTVTFPSGVTLTDVGGQARCWTCHQGRTSTQNVLDVIGTEADADAVIAGARFQNIHYMAAAATLNGTLVRGGFQYEGKTYDGRFEHVEGVASCNSCHDPHSLSIKTDLCSDCHGVIATAEDARDIRYSASAYDYDGDGDASEGIFYEIDTLKAKLLTAIQAYANDTAGVDAICFNEHAYPYWFADADADGTCAETDTGFSTWTARLLKASYNYQFGTKDPGGYAHNGKYIIELLFDSIEDLGGDVTGLVRVDPGHFNGSSEAWRHWDGDGAVPASCSKCHSGAEGFHFYQEHGVGTEVPVEQVNGLDCTTCHANAETFEMVTVPSFTFPNGITIDSYTGIGNICATCHSGRESGASVQASIDAGSFRFLNVHYAPAAATLFGADGQVGYEYAGETYAATFDHTGGATNSCDFCHAPTAADHTFHIDYAATCGGCHAGEGSLEAIKRAPHVDVDYDGDGTVENLVEELDGLRLALYAQIQAAGGVLGTDICFNGDAYPYWFIDTDASGGFCSAAEATYANQYNAWNAALMRAAFNFQFATKEHGAWAHNFDYMAQLLFDSTEALGGAPAVNALTRP